MKLIYHDGKFKDYEGVYCTPRFYKAPNTKATLVLTDDKKITDDYKAIGVEVKPLTVKRKAKPKESIKEAENPSI